MQGRTIDLEYIGDPPILDEVTKFRIANGDIGPRGAAVLRMAESNRLKAIPGVTKRYVDPEFFKTTRSYVFGPDVFVVAVDWGDAKKILDSESGQQFRRLDEPQLIITAAADIAMADEWEISVYDVYQRK